MRSCFHGKCYCVYKYGRSSRICTYRTFKVKRHRSKKKKVEKRIKIQKLIHGDVNLIESYDFSSFNWRQGRFANLELRSLAGEFNTRLGDRWKLPWSRIIIRQSLFTRHWVLSDNSTRNDPYMACLQGFDSTREHRARFHSYEVVKQFSWAVAACCYDC